MECLNLSSIDIKIVLQGFNSNDVWPLAKIKVDDVCIHDGIVQNLQYYSYQSQANDEQKTCRIAIEYYGKNDLDNELDNEYKLVKTQSLLLKQIQINSVDIIKTGHIHQDLGCYKIFPNSKNVDYDTPQEHMITGTTNIHMFENGVWQLDINVPLLSTLAKKNPVIEPWEDINVGQLIGEFLDRIKICQSLEKQKKLTNKNLGSEIELQAMPIKSIKHDWGSTEK